MKLPGNIKAVLFDLDGTVVDSMWMWKQIDIDYLARFGIEIPDDLQKCIEGMSFSETAVYFKERFKLSRDVEDIKQDWNDMARDMYANRVTLKDGILDFLKYLKLNGIKTGIATSNSMELAATALNSLDITKYFDEIHTSCEVKRGKPFPDIYELVASKLDTSAENCMVFEDIQNGIKAGKAAGMTVCAVDDDFSCSEADEKKRLADYFIYSYNDIER